MSANNLRAPNHLWWWLDNDDDWVGDECDNGGVDDDVLCMMTDDEDSMDDYGMHHDVKILMIMIASWTCTTPPCTVTTFGVWTWTSPHRWRTAAATRTR